MCGIFGIYHYHSSSVDVEQLQRATTSLRHRGPDNEGYLLVNTATGESRLYGGPDTDPRLNLPLLTSSPMSQGNLGFGFRRLAILDLSPAGHQPMSTANGRYWIVFNGEIYNYLELRIELAAQGHIFHTGTDTEVILAAYAQWGTDCLQRFNGMWGLAIWDKQKRQLFLARDRFGVKPLYYTYGAEWFSFASEIKALVGKHGRAFAPNDKAIYHYLSNGVLPTPQSGETFFQGVHALPAGHWLIVQPDKSIQPRRYYTLSTSPAHNGHKEEREQAVAAYRELFIDAVRLRLRADVPIGSCLSGGIDSSSIVCIVNRLMLNGGIPVELVGERQKTFSAVYNSEGPYNESSHIQKVLSTVRAEANFTYPTFERLRADVEKLVWHQDEPFGSTSIFAQWCVMASARERGITVLLDGQGADEALGGYRPFTLFLADLIHGANIANALYEAKQIQTNTQLSAVGLLGRALAWQLPAFWHSGLRQRFIRQRDHSSWLNPDLFRQYSSAEEQSQRPFSKDQSLSHYLQYSIQESSLPHLLRYEDRNSMAFSIEARVPFVDYRVMEYAFGLGAPWRIHQGWTKWILRQAMTEMVPTEILWRKDKVGFETPEVSWLRSWMQAEPSFFDANAYSQPYLDITKILQSMSEWTKDQAGIRTLWRLINLELWLKVWRNA